MKKTIILTTIIVVVVSGVLAGLYFATENEKAKQQATEPTQTTNVTQPITEPLNITSIKLTAEKTTLEKDESLDLVTEISPKTAKNKTVLYKTSDENIAKVDSSGKITALTAGECNIIVSSSTNDKVTTQIKINVTDKRIKQINILNNYLSNIPAVQKITYGGGRSTGTVTLAACKIADINNNGTFKLFVKYNLKPGINLTDIVSLENGVATPLHVYSSFKTIFEKDYGDYNEDIYTDYSGNIFIKVVENSEGLRKTNKITTIYQPNGKTLTNVKKLSGKQVKEDISFIIPFFDNEKFSIDNVECTEKKYLAALSDVNHSYILYNKYVNRLMQIEAGKFEKASPVVDLEEGYLNRLKWESSKPKTAKVNTSGIITGVSNGKCEIKGMLNIFENSIAYASVIIKDKSEQLDAYLAKNKDKSIKSADGTPLNLYASKLLDIDNDGMNELLMYYMGNSACQIDVVEAIGDSIKSTTGFYTKTMSGVICHLEVYIDNTTRELKLCEHYTTTNGTKKTVEFYFDNYLNEKFSQLSSSYKLELNSDTTKEKYYINDGTVSKAEFESSVNRYSKFTQWDLVNETEG